MQFIRNMLDMYWTMDAVEYHIKDAEDVLDYYTDIIICYPDRIKYEHIENLLEQYKQRVRLQYVFEVLVRERDKSK